MKKGQRVLWRNKDNPTFIKGYILDTLLNGAMVSISSDKDDEAVYYWDVNKLDIRLIKPTSDTLPEQKG